MKRLVVLLVVLAAAVALAGAYLPTDAATVGRTSISRQALDSDLSAIAGSSDYVCFLSEEHQLATSSNPPVLGAGTASAKGGVYDAAFVDNWLVSMVTDTVTARLVARDGMRVTSSDVSLSRGVLARRITDVLDTYARDTGLPSPSCGGSGKAVLSSLPGWFRAEQARAEAAQALLDARAAGAGLSSGAIAAYFARHRGSFDKDCVDVVVVQTPSAAAQVKAALANGASFAHEAQVASLTRTSAAVGCGYLEGTFLGTAVGKLAVGGVTPPVAGTGYYAGSYWVVKLASRSPVSLRTAKPAVVTAILNAGQHGGDAAFLAALRSSKVGVDPRYGTASHSLTLILPAPSPPPGAEISTSANRPVLTAAGS
jgi:hypothetical protein